MLDLNEKLIQAVCKGQTGNVEILLEQGAHVNCRDKKSGMTPLLKACQRRNYTMQKLLLSKGANPRLRDKLGLSCLHYTAEAGDTESLKLLMAYRANIDAKDANESTPLHYAADRNKLNAVDTLVFCGANAFEKNKQGRSPLKVASNPGVKHILKESELTLTGIKNGDIQIECIELEPNKTYRLEKIDLTIHTPKTFPLKSLSFICRRVRPEYCNPLLKPYQKELLISDTFEFLTTETQTKATVVMDVPIYDFPDPFEDVFIKTDIKPSIHPKFIQDNIKRSSDERKPGTLKWTCTTEVDVTSVRSFNLVAFSRKETFFVGDQSVEFCSSVDKFIKVSIQDKTFSNPRGKVSLEVIPTPIYPPEDITSVISVGHFYDLTHNKFEQPEKTVNLRVPLPQDYEDEGDVCLLGARVDSDYYLETDFNNEEASKYWEIVARNPKSSKGCVNIPVNHFSIYVPSEAKKNCTDKTLISETSDLFRRASQRRQFTVFLVLVKAVATNIYNIMIECTTKRKKDDRMNYWMNKNYLDQKPSSTGEFESIPGTKYVLKLSGNVKTVTGFPTTKLEFHPKRENCQQFQVTMGNPDEFNAASVDIYEVKTQPDGTEEEEELASVAFRLTGTPFVEDFEPRLDDTFPGFTKDSLLLRLCKSIEDEWTKVAVLLGLSFRTVETYRTNSKLPTSDKKFKVMQLWRDTSKHRIDYGVDDLVSAFHRINREDLVQIIQQELENWLNTHSENPDNFYRWTENKLKGPSLQSSDDEKPEPCSDQFFVLLIDKFGKDDNMSQIGLHMGLSRPETDKIFNDALVSSKEHQLLRMFVAARDKTGDMFKTFTNLQSAFNVLKMEDSVQWVNDIAENWLTNTEKEKNPAPWRQELVKHLHKPDDDQEPEEDEEQPQSEQHDQDPITTNGSGNGAVTDNGVLNQTTGNKTKDEDANKQNNIYHEEERDNVHVDKYGSNVSVSSSSSREEEVLQRKSHKNNKHTFENMGSKSSIHSTDSSRRKVPINKEENLTININGDSKDDIVSIKSEDSQGKKKSRKRKTRKDESYGSNASVNGIDEIENSTNHNIRSHGKSGSQSSLRDSDQINLNHSKSGSRSSLHSSDVGSQDRRKSGSRSSFQSSVKSDQVNGKSGGKSSFHSAEMGIQDNSNTPTKAKDNQSVNERQDKTNKDSLVVPKPGEGMSQRPSNVTLLGLQNRENKIETVSNVSVRSFEMEEGLKEQKDIKSSDECTSRSSKDEIGDTELHPLPTESDEYAAELSHKIVDEALQSAKTINQTTHQSPSNTEKSDDIQESNDTSESKHREHTSADKYNNKVKLEESSKRKEVDSSSESDSEGRNTFLHVINQELPSAESSDESSSI